jgi:hypothetical protein
MNPDEVLQIFNNTFKDFESRIEKRFDKGEKLFEEIIKEKSVHGERLAKLETSQKWTNRIHGFLIATLASIAGIFFRHKL